MCGSILLKNFTFVFWNQTSKPDLSGHLNYACQTHLLKQLAGDTWPQGGEMYHCCINMKLQSPNTTAPRDAEMRWLPRSTLYFEQASYSVVPVSL